MRCSATASRSSRESRWRTATNSLVPTRCSANSADYWYYATHALYQMRGDSWTEWSKSLTPAVVKTQCDDGNRKGSWDPVGVWGEDGGRVYSTAILVITLEAHYRYGHFLTR